MNTIGISINEYSSVTDKNSNFNNKHISTDKMDITNPSLHIDKIFSNNSNCLHNRSHTTNVNNTNETKTIDFEALIDLTNEKRIKESFQNDIKEFDNILSSFEQSSMTNYNSNTEDIVLIPETITSVENNDCSTDSIKENNLRQICNDNSFDIQNDPKIGLNFEQKVSTDEVDIISISSNDTQSLNDDGYNSSDFEFITESEAAIDGYIINFSRICDTTPNIDNVKLVTPETAGNFGQRISDTNSIQPESYDNTSRIGQNNSDTSTNQLVHDGASDSREGPSGSNASSRHYRQQHVIPEGEEYLDLFRGPYNPVMPMSDIIILENKSIRPSAMNMQYEGMGFDDEWIRRRQPDSSEDEYADEAKESIKKILRMYPGANRRRRPRRH